MKFTWVAVLALIASTAGSAAASGAASPKESTHPAIVVLDKRAAMEHGATPAVAAGLAPLTGQDEPKLSRSVRTDGALAVRALAHVKAGSWVYDMYSLTGGNVKTRLTFVANSGIAKSVTFTGRLTGSRFNWAMSGTGLKAGAISGSTRASAADCTDCGLYSLAGGTIGSVGSGVCFASLPLAGLTFGISAAIGCSATILGPLIGFAGQTYCNSKSCPTPSNYTSSAPPTFNLNGASCSLTSCNFLITTYNNGRSVSSIGTQVYWEGALNPLKFYNTTETVNQSTRPLINSQYQLIENAAQPSIATCTTMTASYIDVFWSDGSSAHFSQALRLAKPATAC